MIEMKTSLISPNVSLRANPIHADQMLGSHGDGDCQGQTEHTAGNRAITPYAQKLLIARLHDGTSAFFFLVSPVPPLLTINPAII